MSQHPPPRRSPVPLQYETPRPRRLGPSTLPPPGPVARSLWWLAYRAGRVTGHFTARPRTRRTGR